jgi:hypothetical protein
VPAPVILSGPPPSSDATPTAPLQSPREAVDGRSADDVSSPVAERGVGGFWCGDSDGRFVEEEEEAELPRDTAEVIAPHTPEDRTEGSPALRPGETAAGGRAPAAALSDRLNNGKFSVMLWGDEDSAGFSLACVLLHVLLFIGFFVANDFRWSIDASAGGEGN